VTYLWHRELIGGNWFVVSPDCETHIRVFHRDEPYRIERSLCRILNSTSMHKFTDSHEEMDARGATITIECISIVRVPRTRPLDAAFLCPDGVSVPIWWSGRT